MNLVVFSDFVCPFCYLAEPLLARLTEETGTAIEYRAYELRPAPAPLPDLSRPYYTSSFESTVRPLAERLGLELRMPTFSPRSRKAHEAWRFAAERGMGPAMRAALFRAYFAEGRDIGRIDELVAIGATCGLDATDLRIALDIDQYTEAVEADEAAAEAAGITGVPSFAAGGEVVVGLQPFGVLRSLVLGESGE